MHNVKSSARKTVMFVGKTVLVITAVVAIGKFSASMMVSHAEAADLGAGQYVRALTEHLESGGELDDVARNNVRQLSTGTAEGVARQDLVELGNALYAAGHGDLADKVMLGDAVAPDRYEGAELRVEWPDNSDQ